MPTILLLSTSSSLDETVGGGDRTRKDVMQLIVLHVLKRVKQWSGGHEPVALYDFNATGCRCLAEYTTDYAVIRKALYQASLADRSALGPALQVLLDNAVYAFQSRMQTSVIVITDGALQPGWDVMRFSSISFTGNPAADQQLDSLISFIRRVHSSYFVRLSTVCFGAREIECDALRQLVLAGDGQFCFINLPGTSVGPAVDDFCDALYPTYQGTLLVDDASVFTFTVDPLPSTIAWDRGLSGWDNVVRVHGFLPVDLAVTAAVARHEVISNTDRASAFAFALAERKVSALVKLASCPIVHFGFMKVASSASTPLRIVIDVLSSDASIPWLGERLDLLRFEYPISSQAKPIPLDMPPASYILQHAGREPPSVNHEAILRDFTKVMKLLSGKGGAGSPPSDEIWALCTDLKHRALRFHCPTLLQSLADIVRSKAHGDEGLSEIVTALQSSSTAMR
ncbi:VWFA domain-containing protein [Plasmodiophora brassicae]|uniref:VWFA domain-containing protein n=1 Tax=Plasmodiophora brassicae TaxID=37360 RepID=A0A3P3Y2R1_PLABS|nr:unnamed protein product [Plasmodiophora brassicae]